MRIDQYPTKYIALATRFVKEQSLPLSGLYLALNTMNSNSYHYPHMLLYYGCSSTIHEKWLKFIAPIMAVDLFDFLVLKKYIPSSVRELIIAVQNASINQYFHRLGEVDTLGREFMSWLIE